ncbi:hypothetical protein MOBT1_001340 [Malassezia obtusa]|uniref:Conserved oligomeric Golgi complex subunit 7 n=1 Tax=Malassezia obtusa TaxID=76774 RepID=A0AAF0ISZ1_9BASI|nr:hypothetical protein MOBT1_001340 [Malassezia obtusa]
MRAAAVGDDRVAWLADAVRASGGAPAEATGPWTRRLEPGAPSLAPTAAALHTLAGELREQQTALVSKLSAQMNIAHTVVADAAGEAQRLADDARPLRAALARAQHTYEQRSPAADAPEARALAELHRLAQIKHRMQAARDTLHAAESWSSVEAEVDGHLAQGDWERAAQRLVGMEQTLSRFDASSEYVAAKQALLERLLHALDAAVSAPLAAAVSGEDLEAVVRCARVYASVHRARVFVERYAAARSAPLLDAWRASDDDGFAALCAALRNLAQAERERFAPQLFEDIDGAVDALLTAAVDRVPLREHIKQLDTPGALPQLVQAYADAAATCASLAAAKTGRHADAPIARAALPSPGAWPERLLSLFAPYRATYRTREAAYLEQAFAATRAAFEARRDRAYVQTADVRRGAWAACVQEIAQLSREQLAECVRQWDAATARARVFAHGADVLDAVHTALLPALAARLCATWEQVRARHARHLHAHAADPARVLDQEMDPIPDWDVVHASVQVLELAPRLDEALHALHAAVLEQGARDARTLEAVKEHAQRLAAPLEVAQAAQAFVLAQLLGTFRVHLAAYSTHGAFYAPPPERTTEVQIPSFSRSPTEAMVRLGEGLLNLPRLLEALVERECPAFAHAVDALPYASEDAEPRAPPRATGAHRVLSLSLLTPSPEAAAAPTAYTAEHVLSLWLRSLASTLLAELHEKLPRMARDARCDRAQLAADVEYLGTIASALNASSPALREWAQVLSLTPAAAQALPPDSALRASAAYGQLFS